MQYLQRSRIMPDCRFLTTMQSISYRNMRAPVQLFLIELISSVENYSKLFRFYLGFLLYFFYSSFHSQDVFFTHFIKLSVSIDGVVHLCMETLVRDSQPFLFSAHISYGKGKYLNQTGFFFFFFFTKFAKILFIFKFKGVTHRIQPT